MAPKDPKVFSNRVNSVWKDQNLRFYCLYVFFYVVLGPMGSSGPRGKPGPDCKDPNPGSQGDPGIPGPDGEKGTTLSFMFKELKAKAHSKTSQLCLVFRVSWRNGGTRSEPSSTWR